jgi:hypothetical protein
MVAAVYQLTPAKNVSLMKCRTPMDFILHRMRHGYRGALRMGLEHGARCVACCWALMVALFALGVMSIGWMAVIGAFIAGEKMLPWKRLAFVNAVRTAFPDIKLRTLEPSLADGNMEACHVILTGTHRGEMAGIPATGKTVEFSSTDIVRVVD